MKKLIVLLMLTSFFCISPELFAADCKKPDLIGTWKNTMIPSSMNINSITFLENGKVNCNGCEITKWEFKDAAYPWIKVIRSDGSSSKWQCESNVRNFINFNGEMFEKVKTEETAEPFTLPPVVDYSDPVISPKACEDNPEESSSCQAGEE